MRPQLLAALQSFVLMGDDIAPYEDAQNEQPGLEVTVTLFVVRIVGKTGI